MSRPLKLCNIRERKNACYNSTLNQFVEKVMHPTNQLDKSQYTSEGSVYGNGSEIDQVATDASCR